MKIVLITHYFPPEVNAPAQRAVDHARCWIEKGHEVTIVTAQPSHPYGRIYKGYRNRTAVEAIDGIRVVRLKTILGANSGKIRRAVNYASFLVAVQGSPLLIGPADVVISTSPQFLCGLSGEAVARATNAPWVLEIRDVWPDSIIAVGAARAGVATHLLTKLAGRAYRTCDHIVSVSPGFSGHFSALGVPHEKISLIPNGIRADAPIVAAHIEELPELAPIAGRFIAAYVGTLGMAQGLSTILQAAELLRDDRRIGILVVGSGADREHLCALHNKMRLPNLLLVDQQPHERAAKLLSLSSASIVHLKKRDTFKSVIPTKLLEGMAMGLPILLGVEGVAAKILAEAGAGIAFEPENPMELARAIQRLANHPADARTYGEAGVAYVRRGFDRKAMALRYLDVLERVCSLPRRVAT